MGSGRFGGFCILVLSSEAGIIIMVCQRERPGLIPYSRHSILYKGHPNRTPHWQLHMLQASVITLNRMYVSNDVCARVCALFICLRFFSQQLLNVSLSGPVIDQGAR